MVMSNLSVVTIILFAIYSSTGKISPDKIQPYVLVLVIGLLTLPVPDKI